jgi:hypothetical protein
MKDNIRVAFYKREWILMKEGTQSRLELFWMNTQRMKGKFVWQNTLLKRWAALLYAAEDRVIDYDAIRESHTLIKENTSGFSSFRGNCVLSISTLLALHENRQDQLVETLRVYEMMKAAKFRASDYLVVAAFQIAANTRMEDYGQVIERARAFYDGMKARHYFITGQNDYIYAAMLGLSNVEVESGLERMEQLYQELRPGFSSGDAVQALTQVLVLSEEIERVKMNLLDLREGFKRKGMRLDKQYTLPSLGVLSLLPADPENLVDEVVEMYEALRTKPGFGQWSVTKQELLLLASALISMGYVNHGKDGVLGTTISTSLTNIIMAQQTAMIAVVASSAAASSSSSGSS